MEGRIYSESGIGFLCFSLCLFHLVSTEDRCRTLQFRDVYPDSAFNKSIIKISNVQSEDNCQLECYFHAACKSYNLGPPTEQGRVCELSSSRHIFHSDHLISRANFIYCPSVDLCQPPCPDNKTCFPDGGGYSCFCTDPGFKGRKCDEAIDECGTHDCGANGQCTNNAGSFTCTCKEGFEGNGKTCQDIDECSKGQHDCDVTATCQNTVGNFTCSCLHGEISDGRACADFPFRWTFNGTDRFLTLRGAAKFAEQDGQTVLYLDGTPGTYAETPALPFQQTDQTVAVWIKRFPSPKSRQMIYGDWSRPFQFRFDVMTDGRLCVNVKLESSVVHDLLKFCTPYTNIVPTNVWSHVVFTWERARHTGKLYINGVNCRTAFADTSIELIVDLTNSGHQVYDIGLKRDTGETSHAYFSDLTVFNRQLSETDIKNDLILRPCLQGERVTLASGLP